MRMRSVLVMSAILGLLACGDSTTAPDARIPGDAALALGVDPVTGAQLETDKDDYSPGEVVHLRGSGWAPGETIQLHMSESPDTHGDVDRTVVVDGTGAFSIHFYDVQEHDLGVIFTLTGTGATSGSSVTVTFTDGSILLQPIPAPNPFSPNGDLVADALNINFRNAGAGDHLGLVISIRAGTALAGTLVYSLNFGLLPGNTSSGIQWNGKNSAAVPQPDGQYTIRIFSSTVSEATAGELGVGNLSRLHTVIIDRTGPAVTAVLATPTSVQAGSVTPVVLSALATDVYSNIASARVSIDGAAPVAMAATDGLFSSLSEALSYTIPGATVAALSLGAHTFCVTATDAINNTVAPAVCSAFTITQPANQPPTATAGGPYSGNEGASINISGSGADPDGGTVTYLWTSSFAGCTFGSATSASTTVTCNDNGAFTLTLTVTDDEAVSTPANVALNVVNVAPTVVIAPSSATINEGGSAAFSATVTDPGSADTHTFLWTTSVAPCTLASGSTIGAAIFNCVDNGSGSVTLTVTDDDGAPGSDDSPLTVNNVPPSLTALAGTAANGAVNAAVNSTVSVTPTFTDPAGSYDTYTAWVNWDDGNGFVNAGVAASGTPITRTYSQPGVYSVCAYIKDEVGGTSDTLCYEYIVYDASAGFATGGGWINSPAGAYAADATLTGKATFGFDSKYLKGATTPTGNTEFQFNAASFVFNSTDYNWLVIAGPQAQYKGNGTVNGVAGYAFLLSAWDGQAPGGGGVDKFRIKVWRVSDGVIVYDNQMGQLDDSSASTALGGGSIVIHSK